MKHIIKSLLIILLLIILELPIYNFFIKPVITTWGATQQETSRPMLGDNNTQTIISTRAMTINSPKTDAWRWLNQLGADRNGFYSYQFIEEALGYKTKKYNILTNTTPDLTPNDIVRGSIDETSSLIPYNFPVLAVKPEQAFALDNWGSFELIEIDPNTTRLIIRTQEAIANNLSNKIKSYITAPFHYLMERKLLLGLKARAETGPGPAFSQAKDVIWFCGIIISALLICFIIFSQKGVIKSIITPWIFSTLWLIALLILPPTPLYATGLVLVIFPTVILNTKLFNQKA